MDLHTVLKFNTFAMNGCIPLSALGPVGPHGPGDPSFPQAILSTHKWLHLYTAIASS